LATNTVQTFICNLEIRLPKEWAGHSSRCRERFANHDDRQTNLGNPDFERKQQRWQ